MPQTAAPFHSGSLVPLSQPDTGATAVLVDELDQTA
jgi:hypothetical protein